MAIFKTKLENLVLVYICAVVWESLVSPKTLDSSTIIVDMSPTSRCVRLHPEPFTTKLRTVAGFFDRCSYKQTVSRLPAWVFAGNGLEKSTTPPPHIVQTTTVLGYRGVQNNTSASNLHPSGRIISDCVDGHCCLFNLIPHGF